MKRLYIDASMGAAGDMLTAALVELFPNKDAIIEELNGINIPNVEYRLEKAVKCGITGSHIDVLVNGEEEHCHDEGHTHEHCHEHSHEHECHHSHCHLHEELNCSDTSHEHCHHEHHHHSSLNDISNIIESLNVSKKVKDDSISVYKLIAEAESKAHGVAVSEIHFHEVGTMDAIADVVAVSYLIDKLSLDEIITSAIHVGSGSVRCAHGILPVPAPATAYILRDVPMYSTEIKGELCTPTGAALLKYFSASFGSMPIMTVSQIGYGMGTKDFERANCVRVLLEKKNSEYRDTIIELECQIDDMTGEELGFALESLLRNGAIDVYWTSIGMKKNRPGLLLTVLTHVDNKEDIVKAIFKYTTTLGIREIEKPRYILKRSIEDVNGIRYKISSGYGVTRRKPEYEDLAEKAINEDSSLRDVKA